MSCLTLERDDVNGSIHGSNGRFEDMALSCLALERRDDVNGRIYAGATVGLRLMPLSCLTLERDDVNGSIYTREQRSV